VIFIRRRYLVIGLAALLLALAGGTTFAATGLVGIINPTPIVTRYTPQPSGMGATQTTDEGMAVTLVQIIKNGPRWLFHFKIENTAKTALTIRGTSDVHQFIVSGNRQAAPPNNIGIAQLGSPSASEIAMNYSDLATTLPSGGGAEGWLAVDTTNLDFTPTTVLYRYKAVPTTACANLHDQSTCYPDTLYQALIWYPI
jgi:hypothetical protein